MLRAADESAWTIVNSRASTSIRDRDSLVSVESAELIYRRLSCEDDLFTARVYKRNFRNRKIGELFHQNAKARGKKAAELAPADGPTKEVDADIDTARGVSIVPSA